MNCENHSIEIRQNFGEKCYRKILLICGVIRNVCDTEQIEFRVNESDTIKSKIFNKHFKQIVKLKENFQNSIEISYCNTKLTLKVLHHVIDMNIDGQFKRYIQPLYLIPQGHHGRYQSTDDSDNSPENAVIKIDLIMNLAQLVYSSKLYEKFHVEESFIVKDCQVWRPNLCVNEFRIKNQWDIYDMIAKEIINEFGQKSISYSKYIVFLSSTYFSGLQENETYSQANIDEKTTSNVTLGGGFLCVMGSGCMYTWPSNLKDVILAFNNKTIVDLAKVMDNSNYRKTYGGCFATSLGSLIHEVGHIFDLAHTETGLMGNDIDFVNRFFLAENLTEILPKRNVKNCTLIQNNLNVLPNMSQRFTKIRKPGDFLEKYHEQRNNELTFFEDNCLYTLLHHKWFTQNDEKSVIILNEETRTISSDNSHFTLIELRKKLSENSLLYKFWAFDDDKLTNEFTFPINVNLHNLTIFAITRDGNCFKN
jgi:hypothetical protein